MTIKWSLPEWRAYTPRDYPKAPMVLCFGDSWFCYPFPLVGNLVNRFLDFNQQMDFCVLGEYGMEIGVPGGRHLENVERFLQWEKRDLGMIVLSGGGNDFAGEDDLFPLLQQGNATNAASWFNEQNIRKLFKTIKLGYQHVIDLRNAHCPHVPIVTHCYDYAQVTGEGVLWIPPWIKPSFMDIGMPPALYQDAMKIVIDGLADVQEGLKAANKDYWFVDTRNCLSPADWDNEIHPNKQGFDKLAALFRPAFQQTFPGFVK